MDVFEADWAVLKATVERSLKDVGQQLEAGPTLRLEAGSGLVEHAREALSAVERVVEETNARLAEGRGERGRRRSLTKLRRMVLLSRALVSAMRSLDPHDEKLGLGTRYFIGDLARALVAPDVDLIEWPVDEPQFATRSWPLYTLLQRYREPQPASPAGPRPMLVLFPRREATNVLLLPVLVHELGHPSVDERKLVGRITAELSAESAGWRDARERLVDSMTTPSQVRSFAAQNADSRLAELVEEAVCDAIATACLGPSYLLAFSGWVATMSLSDWRPPHPTTAQRISMILGQLDAAGWTVLVDAEPGVDAWLRGIGSAWERNTDEQRAMSDALEAAAEKIRARAQESALDYLFTQTEHADQLNAGLADAFAAGVLPAQLDHEGNAADRRSILLGGWLQAMADAGGGPGAVPAALAAREYHAFLDKGLEMATLLETWEGS